MKKPKHVLFRFIVFSFRSYKPYFAVVLGSCLISSALTVFNAYSLSVLIGFLEKSSYWPALAAGGVLVLINLGFNFLTKLMTRLSTVHLTKMREAIEANISDKLMHLPYQYLEDPYYLDLKERARFPISSMNAIGNLMTSLASIVQCVITLVGLASLIIIFDYRLVLIMLAAVVLNVVLILLSMRTQMRFFSNLIPINRKFGYYMDTIVDEKNSKDFRMYSVGDLVRQKFKYFGDQTCKEFRGFMLKTSVYSSFTQLVKYAEMALVYIMIGIKTFTEKLSISTFSLYISTALSFSQTVTALISSGVDLARYITFIEPLIELLRIPSQQDVGAKKPFVGPIESIEFDHVSFAYPKTESKILDDISFKVESGEKISVVGLNGAGKTTLVKLLCRLYEPQQGVIRVNGESIYDYEYNSYISNISAVFQDFKLFAYTLEENVLCGRTDGDLAYHSLCQVGLKEKIDKLPQGIKSRYTKSYSDDGIELSGGEAQKVAIARALCSDSHVVILDEPTSALDPIAEADIYQNFNSLVHHKTAFYISHRMSSSVFCDRILVLDGGKIIDFDSHANLMKKTDSLYYQLFMAQAKNYQKS